MKKAKVGIAAATMLTASLFGAPEAEAQRQRGSATQRQAPPMRRIPAHMRGMRVGRGDFSTRTYFHRDSFGLFFGYVNNGLFFPQYCFPGVSYADARILQLLNVSRFGPTVGDLRAGTLIPGEYRINAFGNPYRVEQEPSIRTGNQSPVNINGTQTTTYNNGASKDDIERIVRNALDEKEREWASRPADTSAPRYGEERIQINQRYGGKVAKFQYDDEGIAYLSGLTEVMRRLTNGDVNILPIDEGNNRLELIDGNAGYRKIAEIDLNKYQDCLDSNQLRDQLYSDLSRSLDFSDYHELPTRARAMIDVITSNPQYSASSCK